jgi:hypothetical protein
MRLQLQAAGAGSAVVQALERAETFWTQLLNVADDTAVDESALNDGSGMHMEPSQIAEVCTQLAADAAAVQQVLRRGRCVCGV